MTRDDDDKNEGDDDARRSSSARAYAKRRPPALALASGDKTPPGSPSGPFSLHFVAIRCLMRLIRSRR